MATVQFRNVSLTYQGDEPVEALRDISFSVAENEFVSIIGPSGSGKSTLLRLIADLLPITSGQILINERPCKVARQKREIGFVFQEPALLPWRSSEKNVRLPLEVMKRDRNGGSDKAADLLRLVGLLDFASKRPDQLSGGMRQRVSIARALTYDPDLLLMDEPFGALDQITRDEMNNELLRIWGERKSTVIFVTHSISEAIYLSDRVVVLSPRPGRLVDIVQVPLERPREPAMKHRQNFYDTELRVLRALEGGTVSGVAS
jgi:NitT/TauT family transport system ATP-binding protein